MSNIHAQNSSNLVSATTTLTSPSSTDEVVSSYEKKLNQSISAKILAATKDEKMPFFTLEETAYLKKRAEDAISPEVEVITEDVPITLKKGNTAINIKNAASLVKRMEKVHAPPVPDHSLFAREAESQIQEQPAMESVFQEESHKLTEKQYVPSVKPSRNAYEIRADILQMAINWSQTEDGRGNYSKPTDDQVIALAKKFYSFVENRR